MNFQKMNKKELKELLDKYDEAYYNSGSPLVSDSEYDRLQLIYLQLNNKKDPDYVSGSIVNSNNNKFKHLYPVLSLGKIHTKNELTSIIDKYKDYIVQPKIDGLTLVLYPSGLFVTRGDGTTGEIISKPERFNLWKGNLKLLPGPVRMEVFISKQDFIDLNEYQSSHNLPLFKTARNAASGFLRSIHNDAYYSSKLSYQAYNILGTHLTQTEQLDTLSKLGFNVPPLLFHGSKDIVSDITNYSINDFTQYDIDGLVVKYNGENADKFGSTSHHPNDMIAYKFPVEGKWSVIKDIKTTVGYSGLITPIAEIDPIELSGTTIKFVTLHNQKFIKSKLIDIGSKVFVVKANEIIPEIKDVINDTLTIGYTISKLCPSCGSALSYSLSRLLCKNPKCRSKQLAYYTLCTSKNGLNIVGLSEKTIALILDVYNIKDVSSLLSLSVTQIETLSGFSTVSANKLVSSISKALSNVSLSNWIYACGIIGVGKSTSIILANHTKTKQCFLDHVYNKDISYFSSIKDIGPTIASNIIDTSTSHINDLVFIDCSDAIEHVTNTSSSISGKRFVITGTLSNTRSFYESIIKDNGGIITSSVTKKTDYVLYGSSPGSKLDKARSFSIQCITEEELNSIINGGKNK